MTSSDTTKPVRAPRRTRGKPTEVDHLVGQRVRQRRQLLGFSQTRLAEAINVTFQQVQKYERGSNRVGAGRLYQLSRVLDVPIGYFFETLDATNNDGEASALPELSREQGLLLRAFEGIPNSTVRYRISELVRGIAEGQRPA